MEAFLARHPRKVLGALLALALVLGISRRFVLDDAFISFQYARSLVEGHGLTWFGARVEGYTNFLWMLWIALGLKLGAGPILWSQASGLAAFLAAAIALWRLGRLVTGSWFTAAVATLLFVTNFSVVSFATSGLETMLQTALLCAATMLVCEMREAGAASGPRCARLSLVSAGAILARPDSAVAVAVLIGTLASATPRRGWTARAALLLVGPAGLLLGAWLAWKASFYHELLPNSFYAKVGGDPAMTLNGLRYVARFFSAYLLWPLFALAGVVQGIRRVPFPLRLVPPVLLAVAWCLYVAAVGGDFMEYRFMVPIAPCLFLLAAYAIHEVFGRASSARSIGWTLIAAAALIGASVLHAVQFKATTEDQAIDSVPALASFYGIYEDGDWGRIGRPLGRELGDLDPLLASHAVGAIPWYSGLRTLDQYGLNDPGIRARGVPPPPWFHRPGHQRMFPLAFLRERGVNFILGHPTVIPRGSLNRPESMGRVADWVRACVGFDRAAAGRVIVVAIPVDERASLLLWYLTPTPALDRRIAARGWETARLVMAAGE